MDQIYDVIIIGGGAAATSAALTLHNRGKSALVVSNKSDTSSLWKAERITNYPGLPAMSGEEMTALFRRQLEESGAVLVTGRALSVLPMGDTFGVAVGSDYYMGRSILLAAGITREKLYPGEAEYLGRGVSYCATCDAALYRGKEAVVAGYAPKEESDARFLAEMAEKVVYLPVYKNADLEAMPDNLFPDRPNIEVRKSRPKSISKRDGRMVLETDEGEIETDGIFLLRESVSPDKLVPGLVLDGNHVKVDRAMATNLPGFFAAGDITGTPYQYIKAAGEGNVAALSAVSYLDRQK